MRKEIHTSLIKDTLVEGESALAYELFQGIGVPRFGVVTGYHGHEYQVIGVLRTKMNHRIVTGKLRHSHVRVFHAHPAAIHARTREGDGVDINRQFPEPGAEPTHPRARLLRELTERKFPIEYVFSIHEDNEGPPSPFYFYDIPQHTNDQPMEHLVHGLRGDLIGAIKQQGFKTFTGLDAPDLGNWIEDGFVQTTASDHYDKTFETHMVDLGARGTGGVKRSFVFEVPGTGSRGEKEYHVDLILDRFILPFLNAALPVA